ncbi:putative reverse transcriptase domain-containing protein [Tanacetum coccineum]
MIVTSSNSTTLQAVVGLAYRLTNNVVRTGGAPKGQDGGRKRHNDQQRNQDRNQHNKRRQVTRNYGVATQECNNCGWTGHFAKVCKNREGNGNDGRRPSFYECGSLDRLRNVCPRFNRAPNNNNNNVGNPRAPAHCPVHVIGAEEAVQNPNVVTFLRIPLKDDKTLIVQGEKLARDLKIISTIKMLADALSKKGKIETFTSKSFGMLVKASLISRVLEAQREAMKEEKLEEESLSGANQKLKTGADGIKYLNGRAWILKVNNLRKVVMDEAHRSRYSIHPGADKMYMDMKEYYWWPRMKKDIALYIKKCFTCNKVKAKHQKPSGLLQQPKILVWKWEKITMDLVTILPRRSIGHNSTWVIVDRLTKSAHFLPIREYYKLEIVSRHGPQDQGNLIPGTGGNTIYTDHIDLRLGENIWKPLEFQVENQVLLKVSPWKDMICFGKRGKLNPRYTKPFKVLTKVGPISYRLALPQELSGIHNVFHVSNLKKCLTNETLIVPLKELKITNKLHS